MEHNGRGFDVDAALSYASRGFGCGRFSVRGRLKNYDGDMQITSLPGQGAKIRMTVP